MHIFQQHGSKKRIEADECKKIVGWQGVTAPSHGGTRSPGSTNSTAGDEEQLCGFCPQSLWFSTPASTGGWTAGLSGQVAFHKGTKKPRFTDQVFPAVKEKLSVQFQFTDQVFPAVKEKLSVQFQHGTWREPVNPYYVNTGYAMAPATSANDSEQQSLSSDADSLSLTDSSVDGIPPYRFRKLHRREMQESAKANGRVPLPHMPRTYRIPKDIHVEPQKFAAELSSRLEGVLREREAQEKLEERLKRVRLEEEGDDADVSSDSAVCVSLFQEEEGDDADVSPDSAVCVSLFQEEEGDDADVSPDSAVCVSLFQEEEGDDADVSPDSAVCVFLFQEEEGDDADVSPDSAVCVFLFQELEGDDADVSPDSAVCVSLFQEEEGDDADVSPDSAVCVSLFQEEEGDDADISPDSAVCVSLFQELEGDDADVSPHSAVCVSLFQEEEGDDADVSPDSAVSPSILDEHVQRVMKTPGCHSPKSRSPDGLPAGKHPSKPGLKAEGSGMYHHKHVYHHTHHHGTVKPKEQAEGEASQRGQSNLAWNGDPHHYATKSRNYADSMGMAPNTMDSLGHSSKGSTLSKRASKKAEPLKTEDSRNFEMPAPPEDMERNQKILQWMMEGEKESGRHKKTPYGSTGGVKKVPSHEPSRPSSIERPGAVHPWVTAQLRNNVQPSHPFIQDPTMPPNPAPNPLTQLEEARRRLEEERKRAAPLQAKQRHRTQKKQPCESLVVAYYFCGEPIPYRTSVKGRVVTLGQFKELLTKKGSYRYYFKRVSDEFDCGVVFEEVREDDAILPIFEEKIIGKVEKID
ncbi:UNVERIFIED_CONTAM: hypothetical protein FKN15_047500 [Acipenser sinensis]